MNLFVVTGNLVNEVERKFSPSHDEIFKNCIAVKGIKKDEQGNKETFFFPVVAFYSTAKYLNDYAKKGSRLEIFGSIRQNKYKNSQGVTNSSFELVIEKAVVTRERLEEIASPEEYKKMPLDDFSFGLDKDNDLPF